MATATLGKRASNSPASMSPEASNRKMTTASPSTPNWRSPIRKQRRGITIQHKQALIDNLQLEITERARRLRSQYNLQAQSVRSRIEIRLNRIPTSLRKMRMGDLMIKCVEQQQNRAIARRPPPVPVKDAQPRPSPHKSASDPARIPQSNRVLKRLSYEISGDKENVGFDYAENAKKPRNAQTNESALVRPIQVLSPASSNSRLPSRDRPASPTKSQLARPGSPLKSIGGPRAAAANNVLTNMVEKARATRTGGNRKVTAVSNGSTSSSAAAAPTRTRRTGTMATTSKAPPSRPATRAGRRSITSETSEGSNAPVPRRGAAAKPAATGGVKKSVMGSIRKGITGASQKKAAAKSSAESTTAAIGRNLRKRA